MLPLDNNVTRQLVRERQAQLKHDWQTASPAEAGVVESRRRAWRTGFARLAAQLRPTGYTRRRPSPSR